MNVIVLYKEVVILQTNVFFVRHAHSIYTPDELERPLSKHGFEDSEIINQILEKENIDHVISSPYKRSIQTVERFAKRIDKRIIIEENFKERKLSEDPVENFNDAITKVWKNPWFFWEGGESNVVAQQRGIGATIEIIRRYEGKNIVVGTHGNIMVLVMSYFDDKYDFNFWENLDMPDIYKLTFENEELQEVNRIWSRP